MTTKLTITFCLLANFLLLQPANSFSQSIERSVISSSGFSYSGATLQNDCTVGEVITATGVNGNIKITQGFHQPVFETAITCLGDFDNNGVVNVADLLLFSGAFGCVSDCGLQDMDGNGSVNVGDLLIFTGVFGNVCAAI
ncbi:MAG: hypothetical protein SH856_11735 [Flavobacteriales bacterium]|nr:hypothetical protein [Flavobacteriales bacterium]